MKSITVGFESVIYHFLWRRREVSIRWYVGWWPVGVIAVSNRVRGLTKKLMSHRLGFLRGLVLLEWGIFWGSGISWRGFTWLLVSSICGWTAAVCFWFSWWWFRRTGLSIGADCCYLSCFLDGFYESFGINSSNHRQLILRKINVDIVYTCKIQN